MKGQDEEDGGEQRPSLWKIYQDEDDLMLKVMFWLIKLLRFVFQED